MIGNSLAIFSPLSVNRSLLMTVFAIHECPINVERL